MSSKDLSRPESAPSVLKACPFGCAGKPRYGWGTGTRAIECLECGASGPNMPTTAEAISAWNRRSGPNTQMLEALKHMLAAIDGGHIDSEQVDGNERDGIPPHKWHEEWASIARAAINSAESE